MSWLIDRFADLHGWLFETVVAPPLYWLDLSDWLEDAFTATEIALVGLLQIALAWLLIRPLELWRPVAAPVAGDRRRVRDDVLYTLLERLGLVSLALFLVFSPAQAAVLAMLHERGIVPEPIEQLVPWLQNRPTVTFLVYLLAFDFVGYLVHRGQHAVGWWWQLHALHHSQTRMTLWSDDRNHALDIVLRRAITAVVALAIGVPPEQFITLVLVSRLIESLSHANARLRFGWLGERVLVSPRFHRRHHAIDESGEARGVNFAVLFPVWDLLFATADLSRDYPGTGIASEAGMAPYRTGMFGQQAVGIRRMLARLTMRAAQPASN